MMFSKKILLTHATSLLFLTACGGTTAVKQEPAAAPAANAAQLKPAMANSEVQQKQAPSLNDAQLKATLVGHTQTGLNVKSGKPWTVLYHPNGVIKGTSSEGGSDAGTYTIKGSVLCRQWKKWSKGGKASCFTVQKRENDYYATKKSGETSSYAFTMKEMPKSAPSLNEAQLKATLVGHTQAGVHVKSGKAWSTFYYPNGVVKGTFGSESDVGTYTIKENVLCRQWSKWSKGKTGCITVQKRENDYYATRKSGTVSSNYAFTVK